jgi:soluble lytic murein transglycosylase
MSGTATSTGRIAGLLAALLCLSLAPAAAAQIYVYKDAQGRTHFTDTPQHGGFSKYRPKSEYELRNASHTPQRSAPRMTRAYDPAIERASKEHGVSAALVKAVIAAESGFDPYAVSRKGALGLMQLMPQTAAELAVPNPFDPEANVRGGTTYLRRMLDTFDDQLPLALAGYNAGPAAVVRYGGIPPYQETQQYVRKVLELYTGEELTELPAPEGRQTFLIRRDGRLLMTTTPPERR